MSDACALIAWFVCCVRGIGADNGVFVPVSCYMRCGGACGVRGGVVQ